MEPVDRQSAEMVCDRPVDGVDRLMELFRPAALPVLSMAYTYVCDILFLCLRLRNIDSSILKKHCCGRDLSKDC